MMAAMRNRPNMNKSIGLACARCGPGARRSMRPATGPRGTFPLCQLRQFAGLHRANGVLAQRGDRPTGGFGLAGSAIRSAPALQSCDQPDADCLSVLSYAQLPPERIPQIIRLFCRNRPPASKVGNALAIQQARQGVPFCAREQRDHGGGVHSFVHWPSLWRAKEPPEFLRAGNGLGPASKPA